MCLLLDAGWLLIPPIWGTRHFVGLSYRVVVAGSSATADLILYSQTPQSASMALKLNTRKPQRITITVYWSLYQALLDTSDEQGRSLSNIAAYWLEHMAEESLVRGR